MSSQPAMKEDFLAPDWEQWLAENGLKDFDSWWNAELVPVERGNHDRGGWSEVSYLRMGGRGLYVKRQENHLCRNYASPLFAVPTVKAEKTKNSWYRRADVPAPEVVYFGWRKAGRDQQGVLVTRELTGFAGLDALSAEIPAFPAPLRIALASAVGEAIGKMHRAGLQHHNLYPKHIYAKQSSGNRWEICFIDLEGSQPTWGLKRFMSRDLETLARRSFGFTSRTDRLRVLLAYLGKKRVDSEVRRWAERIMRRTKDKLTRP